MDKRQRFRLQELDTSLRSIKDELASFIDGEHLTKYEKETLLEVATDLDSTISSLESSH